MTLQISDIGSGTLLIAMFLTIVHLSTAVFLTTLVQQSAVCRSLSGIHTTSITTLSKTLDKALFRWRQHQVSINSKAVDAGHQCLNIGLQIVRGFKVSTRKALILLLPSLLVSSTFAFPIAGSGISIVSVAAPPLPPPPPADTSTTLFDTLPVFNKTIAFTKEKVHFYKEKLQNSTESAIAETAESLSEKISIFRRPSFSTVRLITVHCHPDSNHTFGNRHYHHIHKRGDLDSSIVTVTPTSTIVLTVTRVVSIFKESSSSSSSENSNSRVTEPKTSQVSFSSFSLKQSSLTTTQDLLPSSTSASSMPFSSHFSSIKASVKDKVSSFENKHFSSSSSSSSFPSTATLSSALPDVNNPPPIPPKPDFLQSAPPIPPKPETMSNSAESNTMSVDEEMQPFSNDIFSKPIDTKEPLGMFQRRGHPLNPPDGATNEPISTNKFYTNFLLGNRDGPAYVQPYSLWRSTEDFFGMAITQSNASQLVYGPDPNQNPAQYVFAPVGVRSMVMGAEEFSSNDSVTFRTEKQRDFSVQVYFRAKNGGGQIWMPVVQGMGFITGIYENLKPMFSTIHAVLSLREERSPQGPKMRKYVATLNSGDDWVFYITMPDGSTPPTFSVVNGNRIVASHRVGKALVQIAKAPRGTTSSYDGVAGRYQIGAYLTGNVNGDIARWKIQYIAEGNSLERKPLVFAAPHHRTHFHSSMLSKKTNIELDSPTMGKLIAYISTVLEFRDRVPTTIGFLPYHQQTSFVKYGDVDISSESRETPIEQQNGGIGPNQPGTEEEDLVGAARTLSPNVAAKILEHARRELQEDMGAQTNLDSMYFSGKGLDKFAQIVFTCKYILNNNQVALEGLNKLKQAFQVFLDNRQINPLVYDTTWRGIISRAGFDDANADFGNTYYNDHHFHYGYFIHAAAIIAQVDKDIGGNTWLAKNKDYINNLLRDTANPSTDDTFFPRWRSFDWFHGHSWAKGLFISFDGKDEESSSEDYHFVYGMKLWGRVIGDKAMENRANVMLAIMRRSINSYMLFSNNNTIMPAKIRGNKVSGILFENKVDYATYFGLNPEYIHGIHMIPVTSVSSYIRGPGFVKEEWDQKLTGLAPSLNTGWKGTLYMNQALYDPRASYNFFASDGFQGHWLDGGMSRTWALAYAAYTGKL